MTPTSPKLFNIAGPCHPSKRYMLPALPRLPDATGLIDNEQYFVLHAPRQSGKTTTILSMVDSINEKGSYLALYCALEKLRDLSEVDLFTRKFVASLEMVLDISKVNALKNAASGSFWTDLRARPGFAKFPVEVTLRTLSARLDKDLVVFFDEVDTLQERHLLSFLAQLRTGYGLRG
ncbi:MAG: ATP-binding protein, partial [Deltaproteobacteria bacterium]|nr:ATP-binding protein [Deltaproteobacteria bacterium]